METFLFLIVGLVAGLVIGWLVGGRKKTAADGSNDLTAQLNQTQNSLIAAETRVEALTERAVRAEQLLAQREELEKAANAQEGKVLQALSPVAQQLRDMQQKVNELEQTREKQLGEVLKGIETTMSESHKLRIQTNALAMAMNDNRTRGTWGEIQLKRIVEAAGLEDKVDFDLQNVTKNAAGEGIKPDMVIRLPGGKSLPIDSKVPFDAFIEAMNITELENPAEMARQQTLLSKHVADLRNHVKELGKKKYWEGYADSPEFVIAFIPSESLLSGALQQDPTLQEFAFASKVVLATPNNLFSILKTIALIWQNTANQEALGRVIKLGQDIFNRMATVATHADKVGKGLESSVKSYNDFVGSLERNLFTSAREVNALDVTQFGKTEITEPRMIEESTRAFSKFDVENKPLALDATRQADEDKPEK